MTVASHALPPITPTPVFTTETRRVREDNRAVPVEQSVDNVPDARKLPDPLVKSGNTDPIMPKNDPMDEVRPDVRPVIERLDGTKDIAAALEAEEPDAADTSLQANGAYQTLRQPDEEPTPVGTV